MPMPLDNHDVSNLTLAKLASMMPQFEPQIVIGWKMSPATESLLVKYLKPVQQESDSDPLFPRTLSRIGCFTIEVDPAIPDGECQPIIDWVVAAARPDLLRPYLSKTFFEVSWPMPKFESEDRLWLALKFYYGDI